MKDKVTITDNYISLKNVSKLKGYLDNLSENWFCNRGEHDINYGLHGEKPNYLCAYSDFLPDKIKEYVSNIAPKLREMELEHFVINKYKKDYFLPLHVDRNSYILGTQMLYLDDKENVFEYEDISGNYISIPDKPGRMVELKDLWVKHKVNPIKNDNRYVICYFYI